MRSEKQLEKNRVFKGDVLPLSVYRQEQPLDLTVTVGEQTQSALGGDIQSCLHKGEREPSREERGGFFQVEKKKWLWYDVGKQKGRAEWKRKCRCWQKLPEC